jgi:hypothetical protein
VTLTSALIALVIAGVESLAVLASAMQWKGPFWQTMINAPFEILGYLIIGAPDVITPRHHYATPTRHSHVAQPQPQLCWARSVHGGYTTHCHTASDAGAK